ncbi:MarR family winged helix-turn-helix transcriptional regulator [Faecalimicrobium sp. JNUCC 81]
MNDTKLENIVQNFITIMPLFKKKLFTKNDCNLSPEKLNHSHFQIMAVLKEKGMLPISEIGKKLLISTPNMTKLINKLIDEEMVERIPDKKDRRIINIELTQKGHQYLDEKFKHAKDALKVRLSTLSDSQLIKLGTSLENLKEVLMELSSEE